MLANCKIPTPLKLPQLVAALAAIFVLSSCEQKTAPTKTLENAPETSAVPKGSEPPAELTEADLEGWDFVVRYYERTHVMTDYWFEERSRDGKLQMAVWRFKKSGDLDLHYVWDFDWEPTGKKSTPPQWMLEMRKDDSTSGLDGTDVMIEILTPDEKWRIHRWAPDYQVEKRGLEEMNEWIERQKKYVGVYPKQDL